MRRNRCLSKYNSNQPVSVAEFVSCVLSKNSMSVKERRNVYQLRSCIASNQAVLSRILSNDVQQLFLQPCTSNPTLTPSPNSKPMTEPIFAELVRTAFEGIVGAVLEDTGGQDWSADTHDSVMLQK